VKIHGRVVAILARQLGRTKSKASNASLCPSDKLQNHPSDEKFAFLSRFLVLVLVLGRVKFWTRLIEAALALLVNLHCPWLDGVAVPVPSQACYLLRSFIAAMEKYYGKLDLGLVQAPAPPKIEPTRGRKR